jgi:glycerate-2-kinase
MKNIVIVDIDTDRPDSVAIGKPPHIPEPTSLEEAKAMVDLDIKSLTEALMTLVAASHINNFADKDKTITGINDRLLEGVKQYISMVTNEPETVDLAPEDVIDITEEKED